ncbi:hypothetical protein [Actinospica robiniae]|uniref:hypothetical protein n=1 Tax=Actinospica robiniae TaxID=304901 RepID=UPI000428DA8C|nr:hypothetical protein [Actinospica robiniae]
MSVPFVGPIFAVVGFRQAFTGRSRDSTSGTDKFAAADRWGSLVLALGLAAVFTVVCWGWMALALPPRALGARVVAAVLVADLASSVFFWPWMAFVFLCGLSVTSRKKRGR